MRDRRPVLVIMVKEPRPGRVKTRLARDIGAVPAAAWYRKEAHALIRRMAHDRRWRVVIAVAPDGALRSRALPTGVARIAQGHGDLGARMARLLAAMPRPAILVGSDIPAMMPHHVARAFRALGGADMVFGPAEDGGFWLVGLSGARAAGKGLFSGIGWSRSTTLAETLGQLRHLKIALADRLGDVDTAEDMGRGRAAVATGMHRD